MALWKLHVKDYGKIQEAHIEISPLTLFVGDNNSGKSYLLSLLWAIRNMGVEAFLGKENELNTAESYQLEDWIKNQVRIASQKQKHVVCAEEIRGLLFTVLNQGLGKNKDKLVKWLFNSSDVKLGDIEIEILSLENWNIEFEMRSKEGTYVRLNEKSQFFFDEEITKIFQEEEYGFLLWVLIRGIFEHILECQSYRMYQNSNIYLPSARTGFMLTKDVINKFGRWSTFNLPEEKQEVTPFTRPINQFLDVMDEMTGDKNGDDKYKHIIDTIEREMACGKVRISTMPGKEVLYVPEGHNEGLPLRVVSAVVTELSPFMLMLKHKTSIKSFFYEEPEMCLHPQLQQKMGKIICEMVNAGTEMVITTHSDIILQHINNMIRLTDHPDCLNLCKMYGYGEEDLLRAGQVKVYQLQTTSDGMTEITELPCGENGFIVPTFNDALDKIINEGYEIQG